jgi:hypothetical protein
MKNYDLLVKLTVLQFIFLGLLFIIPLFGFLFILLLSFNGFYACYLLIKK